MSGWTGIDLGAYDLEEELRPTKTDAGQSALESFTVGDPNRRWKIREIAGFVGIGGSGPVVVGSPTQVARGRDDNGGPGGGEVVNSATLRHPDVTHSSANLPSSR